MLTRPIVVTSMDMERLRDLIRRTRKSRDLPRYEVEALDALEAELARAEVVAPGQVPADVVTMNTVVVASSAHSRRASEWMVVYPEDADLDEGRISVLEPLGSALLGYREGDEFEWDMPVGVRRYRIEKVLSQPEAAGDFDR